MIDILTAIENITLRIEELKIDHKKNIETFKTYEIPLNERQGRLREMSERQCNSLAELISLNNCIKVHLVTCYNHKKKPDIRKIIHVWRQNNKGELLMYIFLDVETSGLSPRFNEVIQIGAIKTDNELNKIDEFTCKLKPTSTYRWNAGAERVHGYTYEQAQEFPNRLLGFSQFNTWLGGDQYKFVCHAAPKTHMQDIFDYGFIHQLYLEFNSEGECKDIFPVEMIKSTQYSTKQAAFELYGIENNRLDTWMRRLEIDNKDHHDALFDATVCCEVYKHQQQCQQRTLV